MRSEDQVGASLPGNQGNPARLPGGWQAALIAALSALLIGYLGRPGDNAPRSEGRPNVSRVAEVAPADLPAALDTVSGTPQQLAQLAERDSCSRRLAWVTLVRAPGQPTGRIRLRSGNYVSPAFDLTETPVRIALPYPAPYPAGHGTISVVGATTDAMVALTPPWHVLAQAGTDAREVTWTPAPSCPPSGQ